MYPAVIKWVPHPVTLSSQQVRPYDPVNHSISIYMDTINIFIRIAMILAGGNRRKWFPETENTDVEGD